jgi:hypothetical protein
VIIGLSDSLETPVSWCSSMVERLICNQQVAGSIPITSFGRFPDFVLKALSDGVVVLFQSNRWTGAF